MSRRVPTITPDLVAYAEAHAPAEDEVQRWLAERTVALGRVAQMQISAGQGALLTLLTRLARPSLAVEVGTFTGYSALCIARGLPPGGRLICFDLSDEWTQLAREAWERAGVADRIELRLGPAEETLATLDGEGEVGLVFLDADKTGYPGYWEQLVPRMPTGALILADNVLQDGQVADPKDDAEDVVAIREFNQLVRDDPRVAGMLLPAYDGLTVAVVN
jgi:caffeoyl-CoA O-methyltransferase